jgi:hypothetical protein
LKFFIRIGIQPKMMDPDHDPDQMEYGSETMLSSADLPTVDLLIIDLSTVDLSTVESDPLLTRVGLHRV